MEIWRRPWALLLVPVVFSLGCQHGGVFNNVPEPTKVYSTEPTTLKAPAKANGKLEIPKDVVILDARPPFDYGLSHIPNSLNLRWDEFTQSTEPFKGVLEGDLFYHARRLARLGIAPTTKVIVVGRGKAGKGEEGRVAWTLEYLGVKDVQFMSVEAFERPAPFDQEAPPAAVPLWKPELDDSLLTSKAELKTLLAGVPDAHQSPVPPGDFLLLDVNPAPMKKVAMPAPFGPLKTIHIAWTEFLNAKGAVDVGVRDRLREIGVDPQKRILVLSQRGVEAGAVVLALRQMDYPQASLFSGGYSVLLDTGDAHKNSMQKR